MPKLLTMISITFITMNHPTTMIITLIMITITIALLLTPLFNSSWISYIIILMMIGGMLILFTYMASLIPNKPNPPLKFMLPLMIMFILNLMPLPKFHTINQMTSISIIPLNPMVMIFSVLYLFSLLFMIMIIINNPKIPLRSS